MKLSKKQLAEIITEEITRVLLKEETYAQRLERERTSAAAQRPLSRSERVRVTPTGEIEEIPRETVRFHPEEVEPFEGTIPAEEPGLISRLRSGYEAIAPEPWLRANQRLGDALEYIDPYSEYHQGPTRGEMFGPNVSDPNQPAMISGVINPIGWLRGVGLADDVARFAARSGRYVPMSRRGPRLRQADEPPSGGGARLGRPTKAEIEASREAQQVTPVASEVGERAGTRTVSGLRAGIDPQRERQRTIWDILFGRRDPIRSKKTRVHYPDDPGQPVDPYPQGQFKAPSIGGEIRTTPAGRVDPGATVYDPRTPPTPPPAPVRRRGMSRQEAIDFIRDFPQSDRAYELRQIFDIE